MIRASAPGKVVLCGEYAVLDGAPAIAMAVDRRATVTADADGRSQLRCVGLGENVDRSLLDCVIRVVESNSDDSMSLTLDTGAFVDGKSGMKLGVGSSAALCVALVRALSPDTGFREVMHLAARAHSEFQGGVGSGIDIATSVTGGLICYERGEAHVTTLQWPDGLHYALLWSGVPASTRDRIDRLESAGEHPSRQALSASATEAAAAWRSGNSQHIVNTGRAWVSALDAFSVDHGLGIFEAGHADLMQGAMDTDTLYKPCGAGGGDIGVALATSRAAMDQFIVAAEQSGFTALDVRIDTEGMRIDK